MWLRFPLPVSSHGRRGRKWKGTIQAIRYPGKIQKEPTSSLETASWSPVWVVSSIQYPPCPAQQLTFLRDAGGPRFKSSPAPWQGLCPLKGGSARTRRVLRARAPLTRREGKGRRPVDKAVRRDGKGTGESVPPWDSDARVRGAPGWRRAACVLPQLGFHRGRGDGSTWWGPEHAPHEPPSPSSPGKWEP